MSASQSKVLSSLILTDIEHEVIRYYYQNIIDVIKFIAIQLCHTLKVCPEVLPLSTREKQFIQASTKACSDLNDKFAHN